LSAVQDDLGNALGTAYSAEFAVVQDRTATLGRQCGIFQHATRPCRWHCLVRRPREEHDRRSAQRSRPVNFLSSPPRPGLCSGEWRSAPASIDLVPPAGTLAVGATTDWATVTIRNPEALGLDMSKFTVETGVGRALRPQFASVPGPPRKSGKSSSTRFGG